MKKLMIAAAAAAMIGGAYAEYAYDFTANLKTTVGKGGSQVTKTVKLGQDAATDGNFWYEDATVGNMYQIKLEDKKYYRYFYNEDTLAFDIKEATEFSVSGLKTIDGVLADAMGYSAVISFQKGKVTYTGKLNSNFKALTDSEKSDFAWLGIVYKYQSAKKWCDQFSYKAGATCYRAAGSKKLSDVLYVDNCCSDEYVGDVYTVKFPLNNRFGATTREKSTKIEVCGYVNDFCDAINVDQFTLAGQGSWSDKLVKVDGVTYDGIKSISGNIVGVLVAPDCESCCENPTDAIAWDCDDAVEDETLPTAAYGSWTLKFNKKYSNPNP